MSGPLRTRFGGIRKHVLKNQVGFETTVRRITEHGIQNMDIHELNQEIQEMNRWINFSKENRAELNEEIVEPWESFIAYMEDQEEQTTEEALYDQWRENQNPDEPGIDEIENILFF